jgi:glucose/arabinose dehydrogenase
MQNQKTIASSVTRRRRVRGLRIEHLEPRILLAGDTYLINFQPDEATPVTRYLVDSGQIFGARGGGLSYGWSSDHTDQARERSAHPDQRLDTLIHFEFERNWEFQLDNGLYEVTVAVGDPGNNDGIHTINVEGVNYWTAVPDTNDFLVQTRQVTVSDGRLTIDQGAAGNKDTRINFVHIVGLPNVPNMAPATPTVTEPAVDGQEVNPSDVHMEAIDFFDPDFNLHKSTDWEIWTVGPGAEPVWQTLGIGGVEKLHTHLGDGVFMNSRAGQINLAGNTDHELRVRFRDDAGSVSSYATRLFHTGPEFAVFPLNLQDIVSSPAPSWDDIFASPVELPDGTTILSPGDPILAIDTNGNSASPANETVVNAIDGTLAKYLNFGEVNSGFIVTPASGQTIVTGFQITTANDADERDPTTWQLFGTNDPITSADHSTGSLENWTPIASGSVALPLARNTLGPLVNFPNSTAYKSYRMIFTGVRNNAAANSMQIAEIGFFGAVGGTPIVPELRIEAGSTGEVLLSIEGAAVAGNLVNHFPPLAAHDHVRVVFESGSTNLALNQSNLSFRDEDGVDHTIYLPAINLLAGQRLDLWVATDGSTYFGTAAQTAPDFTNLARQAPVPGVPFVATQAGYVVELVGTEYRLPVNIAFVPNPGPDPDDPLYFVSELYGSIQVVTRDGTKQTFATGLLDYNPQGPISGSGEQGLTGIAVQRDTVNPEIYHLYVGMLWDNGSPPGGATHYPKVERIDSAPGGLTMATRTVLLNMQPETQGQSHQISNVSIGPDNKLYVHNGDGFTTSTAQNLDMFRGKILRMNLDGTAPNDNPFYNAGDGINARDYVFSYGHRNPFGGTWRAADGKHYEVENGPSVDRLAQIVGGRNYLWNGTDQSMTNFAIYNWNPAHAPVNMTFVQQETFAGSQFPAEKMDHLFVSESGPTYAPGPQANGKRIVEFVLDANGNRISGPTTLAEYVGQGQSSVVGLAAGPDGLYFTELYEETGASGPTAVGARIYRVRYVNPLAGDYDIDGDVDNDDHGVWRANFGSNLLLAADGNGNGVVDATDYVVWRNAMAAGLAAAASVTAASVAAPTNVSASAPADVSNGMPSNTSVGAAVEHFTTVEIGEKRSSASAEVIDLVLANLRRVPSVGAAAGRGIHAKSPAVATTDDETALLLAIPAEIRAEKHSSDATANHAVRSDDEGDASDVDDLFAELGFGHLPWL